jgi:hypothetical protein
MLRLVYSISSYTGKPRHSSSFGVFNALARFWPTSVTTRHGQRFFISPTVYATSLLTWLLIFCSLDELCPMENLDSGSRECKNFGRIHPTRYLENADADHVIYLCVLLSSIESFRSVPICETANILTYLLNYQHKGDFHLLSET